MFGLHRAGAPASVKLSPAEWDAHWNTLAGGDGMKACQAMGVLIQAAGQTVPLLRERLKPVPPADPQRVGRLVAELDDPQFAVREKAAASLLMQGERARPCLYRALGGEISLEQKMRIEAVLDWAKVHEMRSGENPARWRGSLQHAGKAAGIAGQAPSGAALCRATGIYGRTAGYR